MNKLLDNLFKVTDWFIGSFVWFFKKCHLLIEPPFLIICVVLLVVFGFYVNEHGKSVKEREVNSNLQMTTESTENLSDDKSGEYSTESLLRLAYGNSKDKVQFTEPFVWELNDVETHELALEGYTLRWRQDGDSTTGNHVFQVVQKDGNVLHERKSHYRLIHTNKLVFGATTYIIDIGWTGGANCCYTWYPTALRDGDVLFGKPLDFPEYLGEQMLPSRIIVKGNDLYVMILDARFRYFYNGSVANWGMAYPTFYHFDAKSGSLVKANRDFSSIYRWNAEGANVAIQGFLANGPPDNSWFYTFILRSILYHLAGDEAAAWYNFESDFNTLSKFAVPLEWESSKNNSTKLKQEILELLNSKTPGLTLAEAFSPDERFAAFVVKNDAIKKAIDINMDDYNGNVTMNEIWLRDLTNGTERLLVASGDIPKNRLINTKEYPFHSIADLRSPVFSLDSKKLFFSSRAWVTSDAIFSIDIETGKLAFVSDGNGLGMVTKGKYKGMLVTDRHKYISDGGAYDNLYVIDHQGKELEVAGELDQVEDITKKYGVTW